MASVRRHPKNLPGSASLRSRTWLRPGPGDGESGPRHPPPDRVAIRYLHSEVLRVADSRPQRPQRPTASASPCLSSQDNTHVILSHPHLRTPWIIDRSGPTAPVGLGPRAGSKEGDAPVDANGERCARFPPDRPAPASRGAAHSGQGATTSEVRRARWSWDLWPSPETEPAVRLVVMASCESDPSARARCSTERRTDERAR